MLQVQENRLGRAAAHLPAERHAFSADMVGPACDAGQGTRAAFVSTDFDAPAKGSAALLRISALGLYRAFINGSRVGADLLTPGWTCYDDRIAFQTYDVMALLREGRNHIEIWLGDGWYRSQLMWRDNPIFNCWGSRTGAIAELECGGTAILKTGPGWKSGFLPILKNGIYYGEDVDARITPAATHGVDVIEFDRTLLVPHETGPVRELAPLDPVGQWTDANGATVFDFGQNCGAVIRFTVEGEAGASVRVEHSEVLGPDKAFDNRNYRGARAELRYTLKGGGPETYAPLFTFMGFRYARVTITGKAKLTAIQSIPVSSVPVQSGGFTCGVAAVNRLVENTVWSQRSNFIEIPTDCPQRDERLGWTGDAQVFASTACWLADCETFLRKYLRDVMHDQRDNGAVPHFSPDPTRLHPIGGASRENALAKAGDWAGSTGWGDAITVIPWQLYLHYGDDAVLRECFPSMLRWLDYLWSISGGPLIRPSAVWGGFGFTFGDWLQPVGDNRKPRPTIADDCAATLYHFISTDLAARIASVIGEDEKAAQLRVRAEEIRAAFRREYFSPSGRIAHNDQTSWSLAFLYGLVPEETYEAGKAYFRRVVEEADGLIGTGFIGTPALLPALTLHGMNDLAEKILLNRRVPGWLYQVERGATSIWERWDSIGPDGTIYDPDMNSYNHYAYGAVCQWLFEDVAGIAPSPDHPGFEEIIISPNFLPQLSPVHAWHETRHGRIEAGWTLEGGTARYSISIPEGARAKVKAGVAARLISVNGKEAAAGEARLPAGKHELVFQTSDTNRR